MADNLVRAKFKELQKRLGMTNKKLAHVLRVKERTVERWRAGDRGVPDYAISSMLLFLMIRGDCPETWAKLEETWKIEASD